MRNAKTDEMGYFGNVWVRKQYYPTKDTVHEGHKHHHDHVTMLATGRVRVEVEGYEPTEFVAPTFFVVKAEHHHKITALEDETVAFCVFALRNSDGTLSDHYNGDNSPYGQFV